MTDRVLIEKYQQVVENEQPKMIVRPTGTKRWYLNGKRHRLDGPAVEWFDGAKEWWVNGKLHRLDGPAFEVPGGTREWWVNGKHHRLDGPAVEYSNGFKEWWIDGQQYKEEDYYIQRDIRAGLNTLAQFKAKQDK